MPDCRRRHGAGQAALPHTRIVTSASLVAPSLAGCVKDVARPPQKDSNPVNLTGVTTDQWMCGRDGRLDEGEEINNEGLKVGF
jgi:hypothetical protein